MENDVGKGNYSTVVTHQMPASYPTGVVTNVQAEAVSATAIHVSWEPVEEVSVGTSPPPPVSSSELCRWWNLLADWLSAQLAAPGNRRWITPSFSE